MYYSAYDTTTMAQPLLLHSQSQRFHSDTIVMGIMNYAFYKLKSDALNTGKYFNFNIASNTLTDKVPRSSSPYLDSNLFCASPLKDESYFTNPVFRIDPQFIFKDNHNVNKYGKEFELRIDFGDGMGFQKFDPSKVSLKRIATALSRLGYLPDINFGSRSKEKKKSTGQNIIIKLGVAGFCFGNVML